MGGTGDFSHYRGLYEAQPNGRHCLEELGLTYEEVFNAALTDTRSVVIEVDGFKLPILTPLTNLPDRNLSLYEGLANAANRETVGGLYYYSNVLPPERSEETAAALAPALRQIAAARGVIAYDCARGGAEATDREFADTVARVGGIACTQVESMPRHYHYLLKLSRLPDWEGRELPLDFPELHRRALDEGFVSDGPIEVLPALDEADLANVAGYYAEQHRALTAADATDAGFSPESLRRVLTDERFVKIVHRLASGRIGNLALLAAVRECGWIDQGYVRSAFPEYYDRGRVLIAAGVISDPNAPRGLTKGTVGLGSKLIAYAGGEAGIGIATDDVSNQYVPALAVALTRFAGLDPQPAHQANEVLTRPDEPVNGVAFRAVLLRPGA